MPRDAAQAWDAILALDFATVNETFAYAQKAGLIPSEGENTYDFTVGTAHMTADVRAMVAPWRMVEAQDGKGVVQVDIVAGSLSYGGRNVELSGTGFKVTVPVGVLEESPESERTYMLALDFTDSRTVAVPNLRNVAACLPRGDVIGLSAVLTNFFFEKLSGGSVGLVRLDPAPLADGRRWLLPRAVVGAGASRTPGAGALALMLATANAAPQGPARLPDDAVPEGSKGAFTLSNELVSRYYAAPALAAVLGLPAQSISLRPGRPVTLEYSGNASVRKAQINRARAWIDDGELALRIEGAARFWGGASVRFAISASYEAIVGGREAPPRLAFRRKTRDFKQELLVPAAAKAVTLGQTGLHTTRADEIVQTVMDAVAPQRLGPPFALDFAKGITWPFGRELALNSAVLPRSLQLGFGAP